MRTGFRLFFFLAIVMVDGKIVEVNISKERQLLMTGELKVGPVDIDPVDKLLQSFRVNIAVETIQPEELLFCILPISGFYEHAWKLGNLHAINSRLE